MEHKITFLSASSEHPNKHPFSGILTYFDVPSDRPVGGSKGRLVVIPSEVGVPALTSLQGMAVNVKFDLAGHDSQNKIGVIERAHVGDKLPNGAVPVHVEGYLYATDFPDEVKELQANADMLGFSYETTNTLVEDVLGAPAPTCRVTALTFTGASILYKNKAAYHRTTLAAQEDTENMEEMKALLEALKTEFEAFKAGAEERESALLAKVQALESSVVEASEKLTAGAAEVEAVKATVAEKLNASVDTENTVPRADFDALKAQAEELKTTVDTLKAAEEAREAHARRSYTATSRMSLLAQHGVEDENGYEGVIAKIDALNVPLEQKIALKFAARAANQNA